MQIHPFTKITKDDVGSICAVMFTTHHGFVWEAYEDGYQFSQVYPLGPHMLINDEDGQMTVLDRVEEDDDDDDF